MKEVKDIVIDADHVAFNVADSKTHSDGGVGGEIVGKIDMKPYIRHFKAIIDDYVTTAEVESIAYGYDIGNIIVVMSDVTNFRYDVYPEYKNKRPPNHKVRSKLRKWARKHYYFEENTEADDVVAYLVRNGALGFTTDKDLFKGVKGIWFNAHFMHRCWIRTTEAEAEYFFKCQILAGDSVDGIPSISGVGIKTAEKLLAKYGESWDNIVQIFKDKGYDKEYMITMTRLVCMSQWTPKKGIKLWKFPKK